MQTRFETADERYRYARPTDLEAISTMLQDAAVGEWLWFVPASDAELHAYFKPLIDAQWQSLADGQPPNAAVFVVEDQQGQYLGQGGAFSVAGSPGGFEVGFQLAKASWGRGVGRRLSQFLVAWTVHEHDAFRIQAECLEGNSASRHVLEQLGLKLEGTHPNMRKKGEVRHTELRYGELVTNLDATMIQAATRRTSFGDDAPREASDSR